MSRALYAKHLLVRTPLERPAKLLQRALDLPARLKHPELRELNDEPLLIEKALTRTIGSDWSCLDVGCHIGSALSLILRLAPAGRHRAFEPIPKKARWLRSKFPEVSVHEIALSNESGTVVFHENLTRSGFSGIVSQARPKDRTTEYVVRRERLDAVVPATQRVNYLKIDVEGCELLVLQGAAETIQRERPLMLFECSPRGPQRFGFEPCDVYEYVTDELRYSVYTPKAFLEGSDALSREAFLAALVYPFTAFNFFATPRT
jgi:FkbM family methyltransferase